MSIFKQFYEWHPKYVISHLYDNVYRILAELETHLVIIEHYSALNDILINDKNLNQINDRYPATTILSLRAQLPLLLKMGFIRKNNDKNNNANYHLPNYSTLPSANAYSCREIINLSHSDLLPSINTAIECSHLPKEMNLVLVDDYLDPRLEKINQHYFQNNIDWLLLKLTGERAFIGPIFTTSNNSACWHCLHHRMYFNNALRWIEYGINTDPASEKEHSITAMPIKYDIQLIKSYLTQLPPILSGLLNNKRHNIFYEINTNNTDPILHPVIMRPQCSCCGDAHLFRRLSQEPITLKPAHKLPGNDGGVRCQSPEKTCAQLKLVISPVSGLLTHCHTESKTGEDINQIYRSGFFQLPRQIPSQIESKSFPCFWYTTMGKGISSIQSQVSALSEGIERLASQYQGDEAVHLSIPKNNTYILPHELSQFSDSQYACFEKKYDPGYDLYAAKKYETNIPLHWTPVWSLTRKQKCFLPLSFCYNNTPFDDKKFSRFYHNGGAAGTTLEEAILQGFLEVIERDAIAIWWYNQLQRANVRFDSISPDLLQQLRKTLGSEWNYWAIDISSDFEVPVIAAIAQHKTTKQFSFGFGCHINNVIACQRAFTELCQITEIRKKNTAPFDFDSITNTNFMFPTKYSQSSLYNYHSPDNADIKDDINYLTAKASKLKLEVLVLNYSRPDMILNTAKVIIPGTCHLFPYLAAKRLYEVPVNMGLLESTQCEEKLNVQALLI